MFSAALDPLYPKEIVMELFILGATGATGRQLVHQALARGHAVVALARDPSRIEASDGARLRRMRVDVKDPASISAAIGPDAIVLSALGATDKGDHDVLFAGARAVAQAKPRRVLWMGAYGTGPSAEAAGWVTRTLLSLMGDRLKDKVAADALILKLGGVVFHAGPLSEGHKSSMLRCVPVALAPRRFFPARVSRATVAAAMLDEAEASRFTAQVVVPLER